MAVFSQEPLSLRVHGSAALSLAIIISIIAAIVVIVFVVAHQSLARSRVCPGQLKLAAQGRGDALAQGRGDGACLPPWQRG